MAKQESHIKISGSIDGLTYYNSKNGYKLRKKKTVTKEQVLTGESFERTRENNSEFTRAANAGKLLREALNDQLKPVNRSRTGTRLFAGMLDILRTDPVSDRGQRQVYLGEMERLTGFEFNETTGLKESISATFVHAADRVSGKLAIAIEPFIPAQKATGPGGTTHFKLVSVAVELNFPEKKYILSVSETPSIQLDQNGVSPADLSHQLPANSTHPWVLVLGIVYQQTINGKDYPLKDKSFNALKVVLVDMP